MSGSTPEASPIVTTFGFHSSGVSRVSETGFQTPNIPTATALCQMQADEA